MARLEDLTTGTRLTGLAVSGSATVESVQWIGGQRLSTPSFVFRDRTAASGRGKRGAYRE